MKKHLATLLLIIVFLTSGRCYGQTVKVATSTSGSAPVVYNVTGTDKKIQKSIDSLAAVLRAEMKLSDAANQKALKDSMGSLVYADTNFLPVRNGKMIVNFKLPYDSSAVVQRNLNTVNTTLTGNINTVSNKVTVLEMATLNLTQRVNSTETAIISINSSISNIQSQLTTINSKIATIPTKAVSVSTSTTTTTTQTTLAP